MFKLGNYTFRQSADNKRFTVFFDNGKDEELILFGESDKQYSEAEAAKTIQDAIFLQNRVVRGGVYAKN